MTEQLLTTQEACSFLSCGRTTLWSWRKRGIVSEPIRIGGVIRWKRSDLEALIHSPSQRKAA